MHKDELNRLRVFSNTSKTEVMSCNACKIAMECGYQPTPPSGFPKYPAVFVGRNPGITELHERAPFVGKTKPIMDRILAYLGYSRQTVWITNAVKCYTRHPKPDRPPTPEEVKFCGALHLDMELAMIRPKVVVTFGKDALVHVSKKAFHTCTDVTGKPYRVMGEEYDVFPLYHPGQMLRSMNKLAPIMDRDVEALRRYLQGHQILGKEASA